MRIIAGKDKGRRLKSLTGKQQVRPTSDRAKEALFNMINNQVPGARFLDLFAGFGGIGIEALSRGAYEAVFIEHDRNNIDIIKDNILMIDEEDKTEVISGDVFEELVFLQPDFDLIFCDPPYENDGLYQKTLDLINQYQLLHKRGLIIFEHSSDIALELEGNYKTIKNKNYGSAAFTFLVKEE